MEPFQTVARQFGPSAREGLPVSALPNAPVLPVVERRRTATLAATRLLQHGRTLLARPGRLLPAPRPAVRAGCPRV